MIPRSLVRRTLAISAGVHALIIVVCYYGCDPPAASKADELVDIELAPEAPAVEALPEEVARRPVESLAAQKEEQPKQDETRDVPLPGDLPIDAGVDARPDAKPDAPPPDAPVDAAMVAAVEGEAGVEPDAGAAADATDVVVADAGVDATDVAVGSGSGSGEGSGSGSGSGGVAQQDGSGSGSVGMTNEPGVDGAPTTAGTAANLIAYFPQGHEVTALIRFDRLRGTEWAAQTERLLRPMPDYRLLFGPKDAKIHEKLDTLVISTPSPRDATATTLVGHTHLQRGALRDFLSAATPIAWSTVKGGLLGKRTGRVFPGDKRLFLSPFAGWFLLSQPSDLTGLTAPSAGNVDTIEATGKLPVWLQGIRKIEAESGDKRGPALVLTLALDGSKLSTGPLDGVLGIKEVQLPERVSLAMELVKQGWLVRGNMSFKNDAAAIAFIDQITKVKKRILDSRLLLVPAIGKAPINMVDKFQFARTGPRVSYTTSISISDMRDLMSVAAQQLDTYYHAPPP